MGQLPEMQREREREKRDGRMLVVWFGVKGGSFCFKSYLILLCREYWKLPLNKACTKNVTFIIIYFYPSNHLFFIYIFFLFPVVKFRLIL